MQDSNDQETFLKPEWISLRSVIEQEHSPAAIATAIEQHSIFGWDRFGRYRRPEKGSDVEKRALDIVATVYEYVSRAEPLRADEQHPMDASEGQPDDPYRAFGWPKSSLPDFPEEVASTAPLRPDRATDQTKKRRTLLVIVAALMKKCGIDRGVRGYAPQVREAIQFLGADMDEATIVTALRDMEEAVSNRSN